MDVENDFNGADLFGGILKNLRLETVLKKFLF